MAGKPIFCTTHPRACSTAFERVFMTRKDLACVHEPFGDAFYYGPERLSSRFENDEETRKGTGFANSTYKTIFDRLEREGQDGKRIFIKDITYYLIPPNGVAPQIAPSVAPKKRGIGTSRPTTPKEHGTNGSKGSANGAPYPYYHAETDNPTVVPRELLDQFQWTFLIRDPHSSIPSWYRCTIPPLDEVTGFSEFYTNEAGYVELRQMFDFLRATGQVGPRLAGKGGHDEDNGENGGPVQAKDNNTDICVVDADDLLDNPEGIVRGFCDAVGLEFSTRMLNWDNEEDQLRAEQAFEKWRGFHEDALESKDLKPRKHKKAAKTEEQWDAEWKEKYGEEAAKMIRKTVDENMDHYLYLKQFVLKV
ncbi:uncharacterized protein AB675_1995 [Cyphellophora attinorum]|uniref:P-loop containing nucleoside triphosphate hydrolase protein n=1 Tax=Cyphellophora attinorum TaxID=1664694 RepID=A0A0N1NZZ7_9EURO|nr:uncharacterized protein AB675_1995 [Phialophora attinorum]KPI42757.1 hypothetical protein AB675_1995 [Phialophora attinorum]